MFTACIFDWDGTLANTRKAILLSFQKALEKTGVVAENEFVERQIGIGAAETFRGILKARNVRFDNALIEKLVQEKIQAEITFDTAVTLLPGAEELLETLRKRLKIALASMNNRAVVAHQLAKTGLNRFFDIVLTVEDVTNPKPAPDIFLQCSRLLVTPPDKCLVLEDSIFGVQSAEAAGMSCVAVATGAYREHELVRAGSDLVVSSLMEKDRILNFIFQ